MERTTISVKELGLCPECEQFAFGFAKIVTNGCDRDCQAPDRLCARHATPLLLEKAECRRCYHVGGVNEK